LSKLVERVAQVKDAAKPEGEKKHAAIINVGDSIASVGPNPGRAVYAATKAFVDEWSESLAEEHWDSIDILTVKPGFIKTKFTEYEKEKQEKWYVITPTQFVKSTTVQLGKASSTFGNWRHALHALFACFAPRCCTRKGDYQHQVDIYTAEKK